MTSHRPTDYPLKARAAAGTRWLQAWLLRPWLQARLRAAELRVDTLERELANEFGLQETAPLHRELEQMRASRDALRERLSRMS